MSAYAIEAQAIVSLGSPKKFGEPLFPPEWSILVRVAVPPGQDALLGCTIDIDGELIDLQLRSVSESCSYRLDLPEAYSSTLRHRLRRLRLSLWSSEPSDGGERLADTGWTEPLDGWWTGYP